MADPQTTSIGLATPVRGSNVGTWDIPVNGDFTIIDACFGSVTTLALASTTPVALTITQAQVNVLRFTGILTGNIVVTVPAIVKGWSVENLCTVGAFGVYLQNASGGQQIGMPPGETVDVYSDGTNMRYRNLGRIGSYLDDAGASVPAWILNSTIPPYLNCDGSTFSAVTYPFLAAKLGTTTLPDLRGRQRIFLNQGTGRVTTANGGVDGNTLFAVGGNPSLAIAQPELPAFSPAFTGLPSSVALSSQVLIDSGTRVPAGSSGGALGQASPVNGLVTPLGTIANLGIGTPHINMDPTCVGGITLIRAA